MNFKSYFLTIVFTLLVGTCAHAEGFGKSKVKREEDVRVILEKTLTGEEILNKVAPMYVAQALNKSGKNLPIEPIVGHLLEEMQTEESLKQFMKSYDQFSDKEIHQLREIHENKAFLKYMAQIAPIVNSNVQVMEQLLNKVIEENLETSETPVLESLDNSDEESPESIELEHTDTNHEADLEILEITKDNFHEEVEESTKPVIIDVYAQWCRPCRDFSSTFEELHQKYHQECRFAKVNSEEETLLVHFLKVSAYPTTVFIHNGKVVSLEVGNMPKEKLEAKIQKFLKDIE